MIQLPFKDLSEDSIIFLSKKQILIDNIEPFKEKINLVAKLWKGKENSKDGKRTYAEIRHTLEEMSARTGICTYCENNESADVEHIFPKKAFPERTFLWMNYLLVCKQCNTGHKRDIFYVFASKDSAISKKVEVVQREKILPPADDAAFIDPRRENPMDFLELDLNIQGPTFRFSPVHPEGTREFEKARITLEILRLNDRDELVKARKAAANYYLDRLERYTQVAASDSWNNLKRLAGDFNEIDDKQTLDYEKSRIQQRIKTEIQSYPHPTVWMELKRQHGRLLRTKSLFSQVPEALDW